MRYNAEQVDSLAAEYVLGTLHGSARRRFERLITDRGDVRFAVWSWERHLNGIASGLKPRTPSRHVWKNILRRIDPSKQAKTGVLTGWRGLWFALPTAVAAAWLAITLLPAPSADRIAVFADQNSQTMWVISADLDDGILKTEAVNVPPLASNTSYELWLLPPDGTPLSLGLLPVDAGRTETQISTQLLGLLADSGGMAISLEPAGGSPTGLPTGPVVYQASLITI